MSQRLNQGTVSTRSSRIETNPYLERILQIVVPVLSIAVSIFALSGIFGIISAANRELASQHNSGIERVENALSNKIEGYVSDIVSLQQDSNLLNYLAETNTDELLAALRAREVFDFNAGEYQSIEFIRIDGTNFIVDFSLDNRLIGLQTQNLIFGNADDDSFLAAVNALDSNPVFGNFRLEVGDAGLSAASFKILLDIYAPIRVNNSVEMVVHFVVDAQQLRSIVTLALEDLVDEQAQRRVIMIDNQNQVIADSGGQGNTYIINLQSEEGNVVGNRFYENLFEIDGLLRNTESPITDIPTGNIYSSRRVGLDNFPSLGWRIFIVDNGVAFYQETVLTIGLIAGLAAVFSILASWILRLWLTPLLQPVFEANTLIQAASGGALTQSEVSSTSEMVEATRRVMTRLERMSGELNRQVNRRNRDMQVAGRIGRETATLADMETLAKRSINLICNELGFYHAQIFLIDESQTHAVLRFSRGEAGQKLIEQGHQLRIGSESVIGRVTAEKRPVIVNDTTQGGETPHGFNPLLPETRAEMGLPLLLGENVIGVLDIQSRSTNVFEAEDIPTYQLLADQLAVAINNAQLREQTDRRIAQIDRLNRQLTRDAWEEVETKLDLRPEYGKSDVSAKASAEISIRGEVIGRLEADLPDGEFSEGDKMILQSVAERVALAIENARLFQETQVSLAETSTLYQLSQQLNEANSLEDVLQAIIVTVATNASGGQVWLFEEKPSPDSPTWVRVTVDLPIMPRDANFSLIGRSYLMKQYAVFDKLTGTAITAISDLEAENIHEDMLDVFRSINARAIVFIPLNMRGTWKGFLSIEFDKTRQFSEREARIYEALVAQAGVAIDNRLLLQQTEDALERQEKLYAASRYINTSQSLADLVFAAVATASDARLDFWLGIMEGEADASGWQNRTRIVAQSTGAEVKESNHVLSVHIPEHSPMRRREPEILVDPDEMIEDVPAPVKTMRELGYRFMAMFPLFSDNSPIALFYIVSRQEFELGQDDYEVYRALTGQMSTQIQNRRLLLRTEETLNEIRRLYVASRAISGAQDMSAIYDSVAGHLAMPFIQEAAERNESLSISISIVLAHPAADIDAPQLRLDYNWQPDISAESSIETGTILSHEEAPLARLILDNDDGILVYRNFDNLPADYPKLRELFSMNGATSATAAPLWSRQRWFGAMIVRSNNPALMDDSYIRYLQSVADQVAIAVENQSLLEQTQFERQRLSNILETLPTGVLVLDPTTLEPIQGNVRVEELLKQAIQYGVPFSSATYNLYRTGTNIFYPDDELPIAAARNLGRQVAPADDVAIFHDIGQTDLLVSAAPIFDNRDRMLYIVAAFQDISTLRNMENTMQDNLRETVLLYETQRTLNEAENLEQLLDAIIAQLAIQLPTDAYLFLQRSEDEITLERSLVQPLSDIEPLKPLFGDSMVNIDDVERYTGLDQETRRVLIEVGASSALIIPLAVRSRRITLGWLMIIDAAPEAFTADQERTITSVADMASQAIDNSFLVVSTQEALKDTEMLYRATTSLSRTRDRIELFENIRSLLQTMQPDMLAAYLTKEDGIEIMFKDGFDEAEDNGLEWESLAHIPLPHDEGMFVADITRSTMSQFEVELIKAGNIQAFAAINLRVKESPIGRIFIGYRSPHLFDTSDERYLNTIADSTSVVIDNQQLLEQIQSTLQETSVLYQASKALLETNEPNDIIDVIVNYLIEPHIVQVFIALLNTSDWYAEGAAVDVVASWQSSSDVNLLGVSLTPEQFPAWDLLASESVVAINDIYDERYNIGDIERINIESLDSRSLVIIPLRVPNRAIGAIWLGSPNVYEYSDRDLRIYQAFAEQTSLSLEAERLLQQTEDRARQLQTSSVISQSIGQILDLDILLPQVVDLIKDQFSYDHVQVFLMDEDNEWALLKASTGTAGQAMLSENWKLKRGSRSVIGTVTELGTPTIATDTADANVVHAPNHHLPLTRSEIALPMVIKGAIVGALDVQSNRPNAFSDEDVQVLTTLAAQIAVAIENARLYKEAEKSAEDMAFLFDITTAAAAADTLEDSLEYVANNVKESLRAELVAIYLPQDYEDYFGNRKRMLEVEAIASDTNVRRGDMASIEVGDAETMIGMVAGGLQPQIIHNIEREVRYNSLSGTSRSAIIVPIASGSEMVGVIVLENSRANAYENDDLTLVQTLAGSLAAIIQNTLLVERLQQSNEQLREVDRLKSQFLASMSHELRTPLNSIIGFSRVMLKGIDGPLTEMQEQDLSTIYNSGNHLLNLINDILDQAKIEANELNLKFSYFDIKPMVESVKSIAIGMLKEKPLTLEVEVAPNMPQAYGDEFRSRQVLLNLVSNAIKFTQEGGVTIRVYAVQGEIGPFVRLDVMDTGIGIAEKDLPTVFEQFRQVDNSLTRTVGGTGLGLPISKSLAELQGGQLLVSSEVGYGSTFSVLIPTYEGAEEELERKRDEKRAAQQQKPASISNDTGSGLIRKKDVEEAKRRAAELSNNGETQESEILHLNGEQGDTDKFPAPVKRNAGRIDTNVTQNIPIMNQKRDVILVEDNKEMVDQFRRILQREGFEVTTADFAAFAEAMIGQLRPSVVLLDVNFAEGKGWEILKNLKERDDTFDIPIVVTTMSDDSEQAYRLGAHTFLQRPFLPDELLEAVLNAEKESRRERILIIDDQPDAIRLLTQLLEEHSDFKVYSAQSGDEGISLVARRRPNLIILDLRMPGKDGFAVLDELRGNPETAKIPVLVVTGDVDLSSSEQEQLDNIRILQKTNISQAEYELFINNVRSYLEANNRK